MRSHIGQACCRTMTRGRVWCRTLALHTTAAAPNSTRTCRKANDTSQRADLRNDRAHAVKSVHARLPPAPPTRRGPTCPGIGCTQPKQDTGTSRCQVIAGLQHSSKTARHLLRQARSLDRSTTAPHAHVRSCPSCMLMQQHSRPQSALARRLHDIVGESRSRLPRKHGPAGFTSET